MCLVLPEFSGFCVVCHNWPCGVEPEMACWCGLECLPGCRPAGKATEPDVVMMVSDPESGWGGGRGVLGPVLGRSVGRGRDCHHGGSGARERSSVVKLLFHWVTFWGGGEAAMEIAPGSSSSQAIRLA